MIDKEKEILTLIKGMAKSYVPEWDLNEDKPDIGTSFALTLAKLLQKNVDLYGKVFDRHYISFLNCLGLTPLNQLSASGYAVFGLLPGAANGELIPADTVLYNDENDLPYTVDNPVYVTPAELVAVYCCFDDSISRALEQNGKVSIFEGGNLQKHALYLYHEWGLNDIAEDTKLTLDLGDNNNLKILADSTVCEWAYSSSGGFVGFKKVEWSNNKIVLTKGGQTFSPLTVNGKTGCFIMCRFIKPPKDEKGNIITVNKIGLDFDVKGIKTSRLFNRDVELLTDPFYPFGRVLMPFDCFYITCDEAFLKKKARITINMTLTLKNIEPENLSEAEKKKPPIEILQVTTDYWNGIDFVTLKIEEITDTKVEKIIDTNDRNVFGNLKVNEYVTRSIIFDCPDDMSPVVLNGLNACRIRIRITEITNVFGGSYIYNVPEVKDFSVSYKCNLQNDISPGIILQNNMLYQNIDKLENAVQVFQPLGYEKPNIFFGFDKPFGGSPIKLLFDMDTSTSAMPELNFYVYSADGWSKASVSDETQNLANTGIVTLYSFKTPVVKSMFGEECCWLRMEYEKGLEPVQKPTAVSIDKIYINATDITQQSPPKTETFTVDVNETLTCQLKSSDISELEVYYGDELFKEYEVNTKTGVITFNEKTLPGAKGVPVEFTVKYRSSMGADGNCSENTITRIAGSVGFVQTVNNPFQIYGGRSAETDEEMISRGSKRLRHRQRAVTSSDFEALAREAVPHLLKCKCFAAEPEPDVFLGKITLVYMPHNYDSLNKGDADISSKIRNYLLEYSHPMFKEPGALIVREAIYVKINMTIHVAMAEISNFTKIKTAVTDALNQFLDPAKGGFGHTGYDIGTLPDEIIVKNFLYSLREYGQMSIEKFKPVKPEPYVENFALPFPGEFDIQINT